MLSCTRLVRFRKTPGCVFSMQASSLPHFHANIAYRHLPTLFPICFTCPLFHFVLLLSENISIPIYWQHCGWDRKSDPQALCFWHSRETANYGKHNKFENEGHSKWSLLVSRKLLWMAAWAYIWTLIVGRMKWTKVLRRLQPILVNADKKQVEEPECWRLRHYATDKLRNLAKEELKKNLLKDSGITKRRKRLRRRTNQRDSGNFVALHNGFQPLQWYNSVIKRRHRPLVQLAKAIWEGRVGVVVGVVDSAQIASLQNGWRRTRCDGPGHGQERRRRTMGVIPVIERP